MSRDRPDEPSLDGASEAARSALPQDVDMVERIDRGVNALFRITLSSGDEVVLKAPLYASDPMFFAEPVLLERIGRETSVPIPDILATVPASDGPLETAYYVLEYVDGRQLHDMQELSPAERTRFVEEAGAHLAAIHDLNAGDEYGHLQSTNGTLEPRSAHSSWMSLFEERVDTVTTALRGDGPLSDDDPRFAALATPIRDALIGSSDSPIPPDPTPAFVIRDYRPVNVVLDPASDPDQLVQAVFDVGGMVGDARFDVAKAEMALVDVPLGGTPEAESLRTAFRTAYVNARGRNPEAVFDARYPYYRLYAMVFRLKAFDYSKQYARETDSARIEERWRTFVADRLEEICGE